MNSKGKRNTLKYLIIAQVFWYSFWPAIGCFDHRALAAEPNTQLYSDKAGERQTAYEAIEKDISEQLKTVKGDAEKENLLLQQQLLDRLKELPSTLEQPATASILSEFADKTALTWEDLNQYLNRYIELIIEEQKTGQALEDGNRQIKTLAGRLTAISPEKPEALTLQLQYAYSMRKNELLNESSGQLQNALKLADDNSSRILKKTRITDENIKKEKEKLANQQILFQQLVDKEALSSTSEEVKIQQLENVLHGYVGRELNEDEKKTKHYEQVKLLELRVSQLLASSWRQENNLKLLQLEEKVLWFLLLGEKPDFLNLVERTNNLGKRMVILRSEAGKSFNDVYAIEKEVTFLESDQSLIGPKTKNLLRQIDADIQKIFTRLTLVDKETGTLRHRVWLLNRAIDQEQTGIGAVVTKTREATGSLFQRVLFILKYPFISYSGATISLLVLLQVIIIVTLGFVLNRFYGRFIHRIGHQRSWTEQTIHLLRVAGKYPLIFIIAMISLSLVGVNTSSFAMIAGALSVGIGFGMQTIVNNLVSGIILLFDKSIRPGDFISLGGNIQDGGLRGNVVQMNIRATVMRTNDNINVIIPNADLMAAQVVNWTYSDERVRFKIPFSVAYGTDADQVKQVVKEALLNTRIVLKRPEPSVFMSAHADSAVAYLAAVWVEGPNARRPARTTDAILTTVYKALYEHNIEIPFPQMDIHLRHNGGEDPGTTVPLPS